MIIMLNIAVYKYSGFRVKIKSGLFLFEDVLINSLLKPFFLKLHKLFSFRSIFL